MLTELLTYKNIFIKFRQNSKGRQMIEKITARLKKDERRVQIVASKITAKV